MNENKGKSLISPLAFAILTLILVNLVFVFAKADTETITIDFFDVGQGDAALITTPNDQRILIDGGPNNAVMAKLDRSIPFYQRKIDAIILSHPHADHLVGLIPVLKKFEVKDVYLTGVIQTTPEYLEFLNELKAKNIPTHAVTIGDNLDLGDNIKMEFYFPFKNLSGQRVENLNNSSIVSKLIWGKSKVVFTGDLEKEGQDELLATKPDLSAQLLKVPHHGSKDSANESFLNAISPKYAVICVGKDNKFGHPAPSHLASLKNVSVYRTDEDGDVQFIMSKEEIKPIKK